MTLSAGRQIQGQKEPKAQIQDTASAAQPRQLRLIGMNRASHKHREALKVAQLLAQFLARKRVVISADDVFEFIKPEALGNAAGSIFSGPEWQAVGIRQSTRLGRRAGIQRTWVLNGHR